MVELWKAFQEMNHMRYFDTDTELKDPQIPLITWKHSPYMTTDFTRGEHFNLWLLYHVAQENGISLSLSTPI